MINGCAPLTDGLNLLAVEGVMHLDRPAPIRRMATTTLRGLAGNALLKSAPTMFRAYFKPDSGGNTPPAYAFQPLHSTQATALSFPFRLVTWDPHGLLQGAMMRTLDATIGWAIGTSGARVASLDWSEPTRLRFVGLGMDQCRIVLHTPLALKIGSRFINEHELGLEHLIHGAVNRINLLSTLYGNRIQLDEKPFIEAAAGALVTGRRLRLVDPVRYSSTQDNPIYLGGLVGWLDVEGIAPSVGDLLCAASAINIGRHHAEGCGHLIFRAKK
jgi:hypothetical protein